MTVRLQERLCSALGAQRASPMHRGAAEVAEGPRHPHTLGSRVRALQSAASRLAAPCATSASAAQKRGSAGLMRRAPLSRRSACLDRQLPQGGKEEGQPRNEPTYTRGEGHRQS